MSFGVDYSFGVHPTTRALLKAGVKFVCRYVSNIPANDTNGKNLIPSEAKALKAAGIDIVLVVEYYAQRMMEGYAQGRSDAQHADSVVKALGMPGMPIYFAADWDATPGDQAGIDHYLNGAASVLGLKRVGVYGSYYVVKRCLDAKTATYGWQTYAWSGGLWEPRAHLRQYRNGVSLGGASVDFDRSMASDFGQWPRPKDTTPEPNHGPFRRIADGTESLNELARSRHTTVAHLVEVSFSKLDAENKLRFAEYLAWPGRAAKMPKGLVYWTTN